MRAQEFITEAEGENEYSPETHKLLVKARVAFPGAMSDQEALDLYALHQQQADVNRIDQVNNREDTDIDRLEDLERKLDHEVKQLDHRVTNLERRP